MSGADVLYRGFLKKFAYEPTSCQEGLMRDVAGFLTEDGDDILVVNGYAGTGKTTVMAAVINALKDECVPFVLLAPTGRAAKVLSKYSKLPASTIHKHIYRQGTPEKNGDDRYDVGNNKAKDTLFVVDEVSLIGTENNEKYIRFGTGNLLDDLVNFVRSGKRCRLIMLGDSAQLPPVGLSGSPALSVEIMAWFGGVRHSVLKTVVRQQKLSGILHNATIVRKRITEPDAVEMKLELHDGESFYGDIERIGGGELIEKLSDAYSTYGEDETIVLCRSNRRANKYNAGIRALVQYKEGRLVRGDKLMIVKNCYQFLDKSHNMDYIANGDIAELMRLGPEKERYGLHFAEASLLFHDYDNTEIDAMVCLDTLDSETASLTYEQQQMLYEGVQADYSHEKSWRKRRLAMKEDAYFNALQLKYANAITGHKSQGGQWRCVFIDNPFWGETLVEEDFKWLYTALTRAVDKVYLVNFRDCFFSK